MTNEQAIEVLEAVKFILKDYTDEIEEAFGMAISALKAQQAAGDTISRDAALKTCYEGWNKDYREIARDIRNLPYTEIIHCKDCTYKERKGVDYFCNHITGEEIMVSPNDHCSWAEREVKQ